MELVFDLIVILSLVVDIYEQFVVMNVIFSLLNQFDGNGFDLIVIIPLIVDIDEQFVVMDVVSGLFNQYNGNGLI